AGKEPAPYPGKHGKHPRAPRGERRAYPSGEYRAPTLRRRPRARLRPGRSKHPDDCRGGLGGRPASLAAGGFALSLLPAEAGVLLRLQPDPERVGALAAQAAAAAAREPAVSGRLAAAVLRIRPGRDRAGGAEQLALGPRPEVGVGAAASVLF